MGDRPVIPVVWLGAHPLCWDQAMLDDALSGRMWPIGYETVAVELRIDRAVETFRSLADGAVVIVPGAAFADRVSEINDLLQELPWALVCVTSDEERRFPLDELDHPNMAVWVQYPTRTDEADGYLPVGYPPHFRDLLPATTVKTQPVTFAGQVNHTRRRECVEALRHVEGARVEVSRAFTQGLAYREYAELLAESTAVACPSGPVSVDSFRIVETLEAGAVPIADGRTPTEDASWLWGLVFAGPVPFPVVNQWADIVDVIDFLPPGVQVAAWWQNWKREWCERIGNTIRQLSGIGTTPPPVTVLIPTSPIASHPDTAIIEETIASVRHHWPTAEIVIMCDGVRPEQEHYRDRYTEYLERLTWLCARDGRAFPVIYDEHLHQAEMTRRALAFTVATPLVLYIEHDTPLVVDEPIDWDALTAAALSGEVDLIRFHYEAQVHPEHRHLMLDEDPIDVRGAPLLRTVQWSQRPHLATTGFYRRILEEEFPSSYVGMIEDRMHGIVHTAWRTYGLAGWDRYRLAMYSPHGDNIKRSLHLDGRGDDPKWHES